MTYEFTAQSTAEEVLSGMDLRGLRILVTGVSAGIGIETARALVAHGADVVGTARDVRKAEASAAPIRHAASSAGSRFSIVQLDLADLDSVRKVADDLVVQGAPFDAIIANAGVMATPFGVTADGFETQFGTNFIGHFVLVNRIGPLLREGGRLVTLSSAAHAISDVNLEDPNFHQGGYSPWAAYGRSKTAVALLAVEFDRRYRNRGVRGIAVHPGSIRTELQRHYSEAEEEALVKRINENNKANGLPPFEYKSVPQGAATSVWAAVVANSAEVGGRYCEDCHVAHIENGEGIRGGVRSYAIDPEHAQALWERAEQLTGETSRII